MSTIQPRHRNAHPTIKVCGVTSAEELYWLREAGVDTVGFNLVPTSQRVIALSQAVDMSEVARSLGLTSCIVLMNPSHIALREVLDAARWDFVQLHGCESPRILERATSLRIIKACSWSGREEEVELVDTWLKWASDCPNVNFPTAQTERSEMACLLVDAFAPVAGGGTGRTANWNLLSPRPTLFGQVPMLLAGGLTPENVSSAIERTGCDGVDVASGVEIGAGKKSPELVAQFVREALAGFAKLDRSN